MLTLSLHPSSATVCHFFNAWCCSECHGPCKTMQSFQSLLANGSTYFGLKFTSITAYFLLAAYAARFARGMRRFTGLAPSALPLPLPLPPAPLAAWAGDANEPRCCLARLLLEQQQPQILRQHQQPHQHRRCSSSMRSCSCCSSCCFSCRDAMSSFKPCRQQRVEA